MWSPTQAFAALAPERIAEAVYGRLSGKAGNDYGPRPSVERGEPTWGLIASAAGEWLQPADRAQARDAHRVAALEQGLISTLMAAVASHQISWVEDVSALLQALRLPPIKWEPSSAVSSALHEVGSTFEVKPMKSLATALERASEVSREPYRGVNISLTGTLTLAARALRELAAPPDTDDEAVLSDHDGRCGTAQPALRAHGLDELTRHLEMVKKAVEAGDYVTVRQFFEIYRFD